MNIRILLVFGLIVICACSSTQKPGQSGHSHNDYYQERPFYSAYESYFASVEVDIWAVDGQLFVAHDREEIEPGNTIENMYLLPINEVFRKNGGRAWSDIDGKLQLLVDLKTSYSPALDILVDKLSMYPELFDHDTNPHAVSIVISGDMPSPELFHLYPSFIWFDGRMGIEYDESQIERVKLFSDHYRTVSTWDGYGEIPDKDRENILGYVQKARDKGKKARLWAAPDHESAWKTLLELGVGYINTDYPERFAETMSSQ